LRSGDILVERANTLELVGTAAMYQGHENYAIFPDLMVRVRPSPKAVEPRYLLEFLRHTPTRSYYRGNARGTSGSMPKISQSIIKNTPVPVASRAAQQHCSDAFRRVDAKLRGEYAKRSALRASFDSLLHNLMTGKIRVTPTGMDLESKTHLVRPIGGDRMEEDT